MTTARAGRSALERQEAILRLVGERPLSTQAELVQALQDEGIDAVQTTVSRDVGRLGLVKVRNGAGRLVYARPGAVDPRRVEQLTSALRNHAGALIPCGNLLVIHTPNGYAAALADAIDDAGLHEIAGTIAGENTIFVALCDGSSPAELAAELERRRTRNGGSA